MLEYALCPLREKSLWEYFSALCKTKSWPLESYAPKTSMNRLLKNLKAFEYEDPHLGEKCAYSFCGQDFKQVVDAAIVVTEKTFDGLCLGERLVRAPISVSPLTIRQTA